MWLHICWENRHIVNKCLYSPFVLLLKQAIRREVLMLIDPLGTVIVRPALGLVSWFNRKVEIKYPPPSYTHLALLCCGCRLTLKMM